MASIKAVISSCVLLDVLDGAHLHGDKGPQLLHIAHGLPLLHLVTLQAASGRVSLQPASGHAADDTCTTARGQLSEPAISTCGTSRRA